MTALDMSIQVSVMVWADWVIGDPLNSTDPSQMWNDYSGIEARIEKCDFRK